MSGVYYLNSRDEKRAPGVMPSRDDLSVEIEKNLRLVYETCFAEDVPECFA